MHLDCTCTAINEIHLNCLQSAIYSARFEHTAPFCETLIKEALTVRQRNRVCCLDTLVNALFCFKT